MAVTKEDIHRELARRGIEPRVGGRNLHKPNTESHDESLLEKGENLLGGAARAAIGIPGQVLDAPMLLYNIPRAIMGKPGFSFAEKNKEALDKITSATLGKSYKPTTALGRGFELGADLIGPGLAAKALPKTAAFISSKVGDALGKATQKVPGRTGRILDTVAGKKAVHNVFTKPTIGNYIGSGVTHQLNESDEKPGFGNVLGGIGSNVLVDVVASALKGGKRKVNLSNIKDSDVRKEVDRLVSEQSLSKLKKKQLQERLPEHKHNREQERLLTEQNQPKVDAYDIPDDLRESIQSQTNERAGQGLSKRAKEVKTEKDAYFEPVYSERDHFFDQMSGEPLVNLNEQVNHYRNMYSRATTKAAKKAFWEGPDGKVRMEVLGLKAKDSLAKKEHALHDPHFTSFYEAKRFLDLTTGAKGHPEITSGSAKELKHDASMLTKEIDQALIDTNPELAHKVEKANAEYGEYRGTSGEAINKTRANKWNPAKAAREAEAELSTDAHIMESHGTKNASLNTLRNLGMDDYGNFSPKKAAKGLIELDPKPRKAVLSYLDKDERKRVSKWMRDYKQEGIDARKPKAEPVKFESNAAKAYQGKGAEGFGDYIESLTPAQQKSLRSDASAIDLLKKEQIIRRSAKSNDIPFGIGKVLSLPGKAMRALHGTSIKKKIPSIVEEITRLSDMPTSDHGYIRRGAHELGKASERSLNRNLGTATRENNRAPIIKVWGNDPYVSDNTQDKIETNRKLIRQELERRGLSTS